ncbi:hypothetical protein BsWGS_08791 [Bradybaena similaris]
METVTSPTDTQKSSSSLLFCRACQAVYQQPKLLPCLHSFCRPCLVHAVTNESDGTFIVCLVCSHKSQLPATGVVGVPDNQFLNRMCQEYLTEVQNHLVSRSLNSLNPQRSLELSTSGTDFSSVTPARKYTSLPSFRPQNRAQEVSQPDEDEDTAADQSSSSFGRGSPSGQSTANTLEAIRNMNRLQAKVMSLQGEALRVTYAIDQVNQSMVDWHLHKEDLKKAVERRTTQFQFYLKRMEHQLISQIDSKQTDDLFYTETDKSKAELRKILNNILHEVSVLKSIQELGKDAEVNSLSPILLGRSVGMSDVMLKKLHFELDVPKSTIEEIVGENFGVIRFNSEESAVYVPEVSDFNDIYVGNSAQPLTGGTNILGNDVGRETLVKDIEEPDNASTGRTLSRRSVDRRSRRHNTDLGLDKADVKEYLAQFQNARENLRARRKEILERGRQASEDAERDEIERRPRSTSRTSRGQSLDRVALPVASSGRTLVSRLALSEIKSPIAVKPETLPLAHQGGVSHFQYEPTDTFQQGPKGDLSNPGLTPEDQSSISKMPLSPMSHERKLVKQSSDPRYTSELPTSPKEAYSSEMLHSSHARSLIEELKVRRFSNPSNIFFDRRLSDQPSSLPLGESEDLVQYDRITTRPVRRAITSAADRKAKIDFLRENWQKRKEILIQNEGFVSPDSSKQVVKPPSRVQTPEEEVDSEVQITETVEATSQDHSSPPPVLTADPKLESMHTIRSRVAQYRSELSKHDDQEDKAPASPSTQTSGSFRSDLQRQKYSTSQTVVSPKSKAPETVSHVSETLPSVTENNYPAIQPPTNDPVTEIVSQVPANQTVAHITTNQTAFRIPKYQTYSQLHTNQITSQRSTSEIPPITSNETLIPSGEEKSQTSAIQDIPISTTASTNCQEKPSVSAFPNQTTPVTTTSVTTITATTTPVTTESAVPVKPSVSAFPSQTQPVTTSVTTITATTTPTYSRYSRFQTQKVETIDIASLIAAMYSGNEKKIIHKEEQPPETSSTQSTTTQAAPSIITGNTLPAGNDRTTDFTMTTATRLTTSSSRYIPRYQTENKSQLTAEQNENQSPQNVQTSKPEQENLTSKYRYTGLYSRYNSQVTNSINTTAITTTTTATAASNFRPAESINTKSSAQASTTEAPTISYESQKVALKESASPTQTTPMNVTETNDESTQQAQPTPYRYGLYSRYSALNNNPVTTASPSITKSVTAAGITSSVSSTLSSVGGTTTISPRYQTENLKVTQPELVTSNSSTLSSLGSSTTTPSGYQTGNLKVTTPSEQVTTADTSEQSGEPTKQSQLKPSRSRMRSRFTDGVNRRHTIEIGKDAIQSALKMFSQEETTPVRQTTLDPISESPVATHTQAYMPYPSRLSSSSSKVLESTNGTTAVLSSSAEPFEANEIKDTIISYKIRASGVTTKIIPTSLEIIEEKCQYDQSQTPKTTSVVAPVTPPSPSLLCPSPEELAQKVKIREIARKKKERWRHMTIH